jgi:hypothetical protein
MTRGQDESLMSGDFQRSRRAARLAWNRVTSIPAAAPKHVCAGEPSLGTEPVFDTQPPVPFRHALAARKRADLQLSHHPSSYSVAQNGGGRQLITSLSVNPALASRHPRLRVLC